MSPGTSSAAATSTVRAARTTRTVGTAILRSAAMARSARCSWKNPSNVNNTTIAPIAPASRYLPSTSDNRAAPIRISTMTAEICCHTRRHGLVDPGSTNSFGPRSSQSGGCHLFVKPAPGDAECTEGFLAGQLVPIAWIGHRSGECVPCCHGTNPHE
jgi:hypothetical protein